MNSQTRSVSQNNLSFKQRKEDNYKRDSFDDRFCNDLCEEILQYLSLEDKLKLEGVSKQFQRAVLKKHHELTIETLNDRDMIPIVKGEYRYLYIENIFIDLKSLEVLLKKCPNITSIHLRESEVEFDYNPVFRLITKYCNNLRQIDFGEIEINDEKIEEFQRKFGPKIKSLYRLKDANNYNLFPNIEKLLFDENDKDLQDFIPRLKLNKLTKLELYLEAQHIVKTCVDTFPKLTHFYLNVYLDAMTQNENEIYKSLEFISNLKNLIDFSFDGFVQNTLFCDSLKRLANKCQKLKSIECVLDMTENSDISQLLSAIKAFPALNRLYLRLCGDLDRNEFNNFSFEAFKGLSNITHLTLYCDSVILNEKKLKDIDIYLPNIQYLEI